ncbi:TonB-dependent receptor domain-containing protein [Sphingomonas japonica]|uniref:Outer membrane receptor protein involved in Fe transport n=1 Tax=Sphingomonas japonica TaxID=511662 RepID=A0ABX0U051_9SPHN|nr:outer membrane receptor protein involved in Fe transport [Sphingomonas japonica]
MKTLHQITRTLRGGTALQALALVGAAAGSAVAFAAPAAAQDLTAGAINGTVTDDAGNTVAGATVTLTSNDQGFTRTATTSGSGGFRFNGLAPGSYDIAIESSAGNYRAEGVQVQPSGTASINATVSTAEEIVVTGSAIQQDFVGTETGVTIDLEDFVKTAPINRNIQSVILLAPSTSQGDSAFGNQISVGGSSIAENAYYINGLNITNFDNYVGAARVPFEFCKSVEVKSGGYAAEYGRATGGIINSVSKAGTNDFTAAMHLNWEPNFLESRGRNIQTCEGDPGELVCVNSTNRQLDQSESYSAILEAGGPIIRDRLFLYGLVEFREDTSLTINRNTGIATSQESNDPFYAIKADAYPIDGQHLEFTLFDQRRTNTVRQLAYNEVDGEGVIGGANNIQDQINGGVSFVGKYTGNFTDWLTVSGAYGRTRDRFETIGIDAGSSDFFFQNASGAEVAGVPNGGVFTGQGTSGRDFPYTTEREFYRADVDLFVTLLGDHHFRGGFDVENNTLVHTSVRTGGDALFNAGFLSEEALAAGAGGGGAALILRANNIVEVNYFNSGGAFAATNRAFYIQDEWRVTDRFTLNLGLRRDDFKLDKPDGSEYINLPENYAPRIGFTYNLWPERQGKLFGSYGQYFLPVASNTAFRQAGSEFFFRERFQFGGFGPGNLPILGAQVTNDSTYQGVCPFGLTTVSSGQNCSITGDGSVAPTGASLSTTLEATRQTEFIVGYEHRFGEITLGLNYTHRELDTTAEDVAVDAAVLAYCDENGLVGCEDTWTGFHQYVILNPGSSATFNLNGQDGRQITLDAETLAYPKATRTYDAVEFTFDKAWDGTWSLGGSYSWSEAKGNSEGFVQSDFGQDDAGITQDYDSVGFTDGATGLLPNHRRHRFKVYGAVALSEQFTVGANIRVDSPRPLSCFGFNPNPNYNDPDGDPYSDFGNLYGAASRFCGTGPVNADGAQTESVQVPRGTALESSWIETIDLSARYNIPFGDRIVTLRGDVFNLLNSQGVQQRNETGDLDLYTPDGADFPAGVFPNPNYGQATLYQTPRYVRLGVDISF